MELLQLGLDLGLLGLIEIWCPRHYAERTGCYGYNLSNSMGRVESEFSGAGKTALFTGLVKAKTGIPLREDPLRHYQLLSEHPKEGF